MGLTLNGCFPGVHPRCTVVNDSEPRERGDDLLLAIVNHRREHGDYPGSLRQLRVGFEFNEGGGYVPSDRRDPRASYSFEYTKAHGSFELTIWFACSSARCTLSGDTYQGLWECTGG